MIKAQDALLTLFTMFCGNEHFFSAAIAASSGHLSLLKMESLADVRYGLVLVLIFRIDDSCDDIQSDDYNCQNNENGVENVRVWGF